MDRLDTLRAFVTVAGQGSFTAAARQLRLSPSAVTRAVPQLEDQLGLTLISRTTRSLHLTERGRVYLESCREILESLEVAERQVRGEDAAPRGVLKVAAPIVFGRLHVLPIVSTLLDAHAGLAVRLTLSDRNIHLVEEGVDVAVRIGDLADSSLIAASLATVRRVLVASPAYLAAHGAPADPAALAGHRIVAFEALDALDDWRFGDEVVRLDPRLVVNSADAAIAAAEAGQGITRALSYQVQAAVEAGRLVPLLLDHAPPAVPVSAVYPARRIPSANVAAFVRAARDHFKARPLTPVEGWPVEAWPGRG